ncbi:MAG: hypothetical protein JXB05_37955 [Myxococcaceae bacterium]|nr:hypothetical protein [Myxococcaceae bacterium]
MARAKSGVRWGGALLGALLLAGGAVASPERGKGRGGSGSAGTDHCAQLGEMIQELESKARAMAVADGCADVSQCKAAPVGARACGGPRDYLVYCAARTDESALQQALTRLQREEERYNQQCGIVSTCIFLDEPKVELVDGVCQKVEAAPIELP